MIKKTGYLLVALLLISLTACTIHVPYDYEPGYAFGRFKIVFQIEPDDAQILLDGKLIGEAYEFSTWESALKLSSRRHEIIIKREGFREELVDLFRYGSKNIRVRMTMAALKPLAGQPVAPGPDPYRAETIKEKKLPAEVTVQPKETAPAAPAVPVIISIQPEESAIYLDGRFWGIAPDSGTISNLRLHPGTYRLEVLHPDYKSYSKKLTVKPGREIKLNVKLEKKQLR